MMQETTFKVSEERISSILENSEVQVHSFFNKCTVVACKLPSGFVLVEQCSCIDESIYDEEHGKQMCIDRIRETLRNYEGYALQKNSWMFSLSGK